MHRPLPSINTDQGSQFTSFEFTAALKNAGVAISKDLGPAVAIHGVSQGLDAEPGIEGVGQPPGEHAAGGPVHETATKYKKPRWTGM